MGLSLCFFTFMHLLSSFLMFHLAFAHFTSSMQPLCHDHDRSALLKFKASLVIDYSASDNYPSAYPKVASWNLDSDCCSWDGVKCNENTGRVVELDLASSCLYGSINSTSTLFHLVHLQRLNLSDNNFSFSEIPSEILNFSRLTHLDLSDSFFSGQIPAELLDLSNLEVLDLSFNGEFLLKLQKPGLAILAEKLTNLKVLNLINVNISSAVPHILANLSSLRILSLSGCLLQGEFPPEIFQLPNLHFLGMMKNRNLTGYLPEFQKSSLLRDLRLHHTGFLGKIPYSIENLKSLSCLDISSCSFSGTIPPSLGNLTNLECLFLSDNEFLGGLPTSIGNLAFLKALEFSSFNFSGKILASLGNLTQLSSLSITGSSFSGLNSSSLSWVGNLNQLALLDFSGSNLTGEIPYVLSNLTQLAKLYLEHNQLTGPIPYWLMNLNKLSFLDLRFNQLSGHIPVEIRNLTQLQSLVFSSNQLEGSIPTSIFELRNLVRLDLSFNNLGGTVDLNMLLLSLKSLEAIVLSSNKISVLTRNATSNMNKFGVLGFSSCNLSEFPYFLFNQDDLVSLDLSSNKIVGQVPAWFLNVSPNNLEYLNLSHNLLTGFEHDLFVLPWNDLSTLDLRFNKLKGPLPVPSVSTFSYLISNNWLIGEIPPSICSLNGLHALDLSYNNLSGMLPECLGNFSYELSVLKLQGNNFYGSIPQSFMSRTELRMIDLSNNSLQGRVPKSLANCLMLKFLNLGNNQITDVFPSWLGALPELEVLVLKFNRFHGVIKEPEAGFDFPKLRIIDLSHNRFVGNLPSKLFDSWNSMKDVNASNLTYMQDRLSPQSYPEFTRFGLFDYSLTLSNKGTELEYEKLSNLITAIILSNNSFVGEIPKSIANLKGLRNLNLSQNNLEGQIPSSLSNLKALESLDLSSNKLSGNIPQQLEEITSLAVFDVSHNNLTGAIPRGNQFNTFENSSFDGNAGLCGEPLSKKCENSEASPDEDQQSESLFEFGWEVVLIGYACGTIIGVVLGHIFSTRKHEWFVKTFRLRRKVIKGGGGDTCNECN